MGGLGATFEDVAEAEAICLRKGDDSDGGSANAPFAVYVQPEHTVFADEITVCNAFKALGCGNIVTRARRSGKECGRGDLRNAGGRIAWVIFPIRSDIRLFKGRPVDACGGLVPEGQGGRPIGGPRLIPD